MEILKQLNANSAGVKKILNVKPAKVVEISNAHHASMDLS